MDLWIDLLVDRASPLSGIDDKDPLIGRFRCHRDGRLLWQVAGRFELPDGKEATVGDVLALAALWGRATDSDKPWSNPRPVRTDGLSGTEIKVHTLGPTISRFLFPGKVLPDGGGAKPVDVRGRVNEDVAGLSLRERLAIRLTTDQSIGFLPAEFAHGPGSADPIARRADMAVVRCVDTMQAKTEAPVPVEDRLRILHITWPGKITSEGSGEGTEDDERSEQGRREMLDQCRHAIVRHVAAVSPSAVLAAISDVEPHVLVIGTHGHGPTRDEPSGVIACGLENCEADRWLSGKQLAEAVKRIPGPRLAAVLSCESGLSTDAGPGVAATLAGAGVPSILAMSGRPRLSHGAQYLELVRYMSEGVTVTEALRRAVDAVWGSNLSEPYHHVLIARDPDHQLRTIGRTAVRAGGATGTAAAYLSPADRVVGQHNGSRFRVPLLLAERVKATVSVSAGGESIEVGVGPGGTMPANLERDLCAQVADLLRGADLDRTMSVRISLTGLDRRTLLYGGSDAAATAIAAALSLAVVGDTSSAAHLWQLAEPGDDPPRYWHLIDDATGEVRRRVRLPKTPRGNWVIFECDVREDVARRQLDPEAMQKLVSPTWNVGDEQAALSALERRFGIYANAGLRRRLPQLIRVLQPSDLFAVGEARLGVLLPTDEAVRRLKRSLGEPVFESRQT